MARKKERTAKRFHKIGVKFKPKRTPTPSLLSTKIGYNIICIHCKMLYYNANLLLIYKLTYHLLVGEKSLVSEVEKPNFIANRRRIQEVHIATAAQIAKPSS